MIYSVEGNSGTPLGKRPCPVFRSGLARPTTKWGQGSLSGNDAGVVVGRPIPSANILLLVLAIGWIPWGGTSLSAQDRPARLRANDRPAANSPAIPALFARVTQGMGPSVFDDGDTLPPPAQPRGPRGGSAARMQRVWELEQWEEEGVFHDGSHQGDRTVLSHPEHWGSHPEHWGEAGVHSGDCCPPLGIFACSSWEGFAGVQGFTGPMNRGSTGSFGFHQGLNWGRHLPLLFGDAVAGQVGVRAVQSNFRGAEFTDDERRQVFLTGGLFRRVDWGLQGGAVVDYLHESWYLQADFVQIRGELSWVFPDHHELGFWFSANGQQQTVNSTTTRDGQTRTEQETWEGTDLYAFFYRFRADNCGGATGRLFAGFTGQSGGLLGADWTLPLNENWALESGFTYLIPQESRGLGGHLDDAWNVGLSLVWRPGGGFARQSYARPLFDVASNGTFFVHRR
jgi:hypothetical protein